MPEIFFYQSWGSKLTIKVRIRCLARGCFHPTALSFGNYVTWRWNKVEGTKPIYETLPCSANQLPMLDFANGGAGGIQAFRAPHMTSAL